MLAHLTRARLVRRVFPLLGAVGDEGHRRQHQAMERRAGQAGPVLGELTLQTAACSESPAKRQNMTFGLPLNMRANCVRTLAACVWVGAAITFGFSMCAVI